MSGISAISKRIVRAAIAAVVGAAAAQASAASPLVTTDWLEKNLNSPAVRVLEVSVNPGLYERGHIPGASNLNWHTDLVVAVNRDISSQGKLQDVLRRAGVNQDSTTVLYGDNNNWFLAWGAWVLDVYGVDNVKILDGGRKKWEADGRPLSASFASALAAGDFKLQVLRAPDIARKFSGGVLMGWGAMILLGCTVGVLLSGVMANAVSGWVFAFFCLLGIWVSL